MKCPYCGEELRNGVVYTSTNGAIWMPENVKLKWFWSRGDLLKNGGIAVVPAMIKPNATLKAKLCFKCKKMIADIENM